MPAAQLFSAAIERSLNYLLKLDPEAAHHLKPLQGKQLQVSLDEMPWPLRFSFSDQIDVLIPQTSDTPSADCEISLSLNILQDLQDSSQITRLIKEDKLQLEGDLNVAQGFSGMLKNIRIDWEEQLARYTGDVPAHSLFAAGKSILKTASNTLAQVRSIVSEGALEEKRIAAPTMLVNRFSDQVNSLRSDTSRLEARLALLESATEKNREE